jgi:hypothetical protein
MPEVTTRNAVYLFCIARTGSLPAIEGTGLDDRSPLFLHSVMDITAVASFVSLEVFCGPAAESAMQDLSWVGPRACRHEQVVERVMDRSPVLPVRFGTIFSSLENMEKRLREHHGRISGFLDEVADREEWAVKGLLERSKANESVRQLLLAGEERYLSSLSPGVRYLHQQRILANSEKELNRILNDISAVVARDLSCHAVNFRERELLSGKIMGGERDMALNWAFLVPRVNVTDFRNVICRANEDHARWGLLFDVSGPWPPYSFSPSLNKETN